MSDQPFQKCACQHCGDSIEFPAQGVGLRIDCPHCNQRTLLTAGGETEPTLTPPLTPQAVEETVAPVPLDDAIPGQQLEPAKSKPLALIGALVAIGLLAGGGLWFSKTRPARNSADAASAAPEQESPTPTSAPIGVSGDSSTGATKAATTAKVEKSLDDLKPGPVTLEKAKSGNLIYAVGKLKNDSPHQRFGVKIEIECTDAKGRPAGKASDYTQVIEPGQEWRFRALVLESKATAGKVVDIQEDN